MYVSINIIKGNIRGIILLTLLMTVILIVGRPLEVNASRSTVDFYSLGSAPGGSGSLETLIAKWWNWWTNHPVNIANNWPACLKEEETIRNNQSVVFLGDPANAVQKNANARNQKCEISSSQLLYLTVYPGECSTGSKPHEGEYPETKSPAGLLQCAQGANQEIKLMRVKVDGKDVSPNIIRQTTSKPFNYIVHPDNAYGWKAPIVGGNNTSMAENYYLFFKPLPVGVHTIELEVIRKPLQSNQPIEHDIAKWDIKVVP